MTDINKKPFTEETELKLDIFKKCFREWFPVFLNSKDFTERVYVYDLFAGSGTDSNGRLGTNSVRYAVSDSGDMRSLVFQVFLRLQS